MKKISLSLFTLLIFFHAFTQSSLNFELLAKVPHNELSNDVWGYVDAMGTEYAIVGTRSSTKIYSLESPDKPILRKSIPGVSSIWRDFKSFGTFIYATSDQGADGLTIIDMSQAPDSFAVTRWKNEIEINGVNTVLRTCHNLYIDSSGIAYLAGCNPGNGGIIMLDIKSNPTDPKVIGIENEKYAHDVIVKDSFMYASEIYEGNLGIYSINNPTNPKLISRTTTSGLFTHNAWPSDDGKYIFTTDERGNAFLDSYDISDPKNPKFLDKYQPVANQNVIPHNTHYHNGYLVTSWYTEGVVVVDASRPDNLVKVAQYDTNPQDVDGCWGVYPFLPSGVVIASDMDNGFFVLKPNYKRASFVEGTIKDSENTSPINGVQVLAFSNNSSSLLEQSNAEGKFKTGTADPGNIKLIFSHPAYFPDTISASLSTGQVQQLNVLLKPKRTHSLGITVKSSSGQVIQNARVLILAAEGNTELNLGALGVGSKNLLEGKVKIQTAAWGYIGKETLLEFNQAKTLNILLEPGYEDDFFVDLGWKSDGNGSSGFWTRAIPKATFLNGSLSNPAVDLPTDIGDFCFVTGNNDSSVGADDVDNGSVNLRSPVMLLKSYSDPTIAFSPWFVNGGGSTMPNDSMKVFLSDGKSTKLVRAFTDSQTNQSFWRDTVNIRISDYFQQFDSVQLIVTATDDPANGHIVEAAIDGFKVFEGSKTTSTSDLTAISDVIYPNPVSNYLNIRTDQIKSNFHRLELRDARGVLVYHSNRIVPGIDVSNFSSGLFFLTLYYENGYKSTEAFVKSQY